MSVTVPVIGSGPGLPVPICSGALSVGSRTGGKLYVMSGFAGLTVNVTGLLVWPLVTTETLYVPREAVAAITNVAVSEVALPTVTVPAETPDPLILSVSEPGAVAKFVPVKVTVTLVPLKPDAGEMEANVGTGIWLTTKGTGCVVPPAAVTVTL